MNNEKKSTLTVEINGRQITAPYGARLLDVCHREGIHIPGLCFHHTLPGYAACRLCVVELHKGNWSKLVTSCEYPLLKEGERFSTDSNKVWKSRFTSAELLLARAPEARTVLEKVLRRPIETSARFVSLEVDNKKCVLCGLCYRLCSAQGTAAISTTGRGAHKVVTTPYHEANDACIGCGSCAAICPTGAITMREPPGKRAIWRQLFELEKCPTCGLPHITLRMIDHLKKNTDLPEDVIRLCPACRLRHLGDTILAGISPGDTHDPPT